MSLCSGSQLALLRTAWRTSFLANGVLPSATVAAERVLECYINKLEYGSSQFIQSQSIMHTPALALGLPGLFLTPYALFFLTITFVVIVLYVKSRAQGLSPPTVPGHWFFKNQELLGAPWRGILMAEKYKPQYGVFIMPKRNLVGFDNSGDTVGDIVQLSTPFKTTVVLNSSQAVSEVLEKHWRSTSDRPRNVMLLDM
jgi:hypothetical protein